MPETTTMSHLSGPFVAVQDVQVPERKLFFPRIEWDLMILMVISLWFIDGISIVNGILTMVQKGSISSGKRLHSY